VRSWEADAEDGAGAHVHEVLWLAVAAEFFSGEQEPVPGEESRLQLPRVIRRAAPSSAYRPHTDVLRWVVEQKEITNLDDDLRQEVCPVSHLLRRAEQIMRSSYEEMEELALARMKKQEGKDRAVLLPVDDDLHLHLHLHVVGVGAGGEDDGGAPWSLVGGARHRRSARVGGSGRDLLGRVSHEGVLLVDRRGSFFSLLVAAGHAGGVGPILSVSLVSEPTTSITPAFSVCNSGAMLMVFLVPASVFVVQNWRLLGISMPSFFLVFSWNNFAGAIRKLTQFSNIPLQPHK
jgi:hypothetical protein